MKSSTKHRRTDQYIGNSSTQLNATQDISAKIYNALYYPNHYCRYLFFLDDPSVLIHARTALLIQTVGVGELVHLLL